MKECEGDSSQKKCEAVDKEYRTSGGQTDVTDQEGSFSAAFADDLLISPPRLVWTVK